MTMKEFIAISDTLYNMQNDTSDYEHRTLGKMTWSYEMVILFKPRLAVG